MIKPVNGHILIEPIAQSGFVATQNDTYQEIGTIVDVADDIVNNLARSNKTLNLIGNRVYFDSWLAAKYPKGEDGFYWLVKWDDVRALENDLHTA